MISPKKSFAVFAATKTEKDEWMAHIKKCIADLLSKGKLFGLCIYVHAYMYIHMCKYLAIADYILY